MNNLEDVSFVELQKKIDDMKKIRDSLFREINSKQLEAQNYRDTIFAYEKKIDDLKLQIGQLDNLVVKRSEEVATLDSKTSHELRTIEAHRRDLITLRESVNNEQLLWTSEKKANMEAIEEDRRKLARLESSLNTREADLKQHEMEMTAQIEDIGKRRTDIQSLEIKLQAKHEEADKKVLDAEDKQRKAEKVLGDAEAARVRFEELIKENKEHQAGFASKEAQIRIAQEEIELKRKELADRERDVVLEEDRVRQVKDKVRKEVEYASISKKKMVELKSELGSKEEK